MKHGSLFSGIGGADLAAQWAGWENVFHCEKEKFCQTILKYYWPNAKLYEDITTTDFTIWRGHVDVLTGGFPCQPFSVAGKRKGTEDERHLWPQMLRAIREIRPRWVVGENVRGIVNWKGGMVFEQVCADMENEGYKVIPFILPACAVDAPHRRDRVWFVAYAKGFGMHGEEGNIRKENGRPVGELLSKSNKPSIGLCEERITSDTNSDDARRCGLRETGSAPSEMQGDKEERQRIRNEFKRDDVAQVASYANGVRLRDEINRNGKPKFIDKISAPNDWGNFPTQSPVCSGNDGLSARLDGITFSKWRNESIKGFGNAWVPQVALQIFKAINEIENR